MKLAAAKHFTEIAKKLESMTMRVIEIVVIGSALFLAFCVFAVAGDNSRQGQQEWCWQSGNSTVMFCDYVTYSSCQASNRGKEPGACVHR